MDRIDGDPTSTAKKSRRPLDTRALSLAVSVGAGVAVGLAAAPDAAQAATSSYCYIRDLYAFPANPASYCEGPNLAHKYSGQIAEMYPFRPAGYDPCISYYNSLYDTYGPYCAASEGTTGYVSSYPAPDRYKTLFAWHATGGQSYMLAVAKYP